MQKKVLKEKKIGTKLLVMGRFLVDDTRLELVTSRTSTPGQNFFQRFIVLFNCFCSYLVAFQVRLIVSLPHIPRASVVSYVVKTLPNSDR